LQKSSDSQVLVSVLLDISISKWVRVEDNSRMKEAGLPLYVRLLLMVLTLRFV
jgi:hypothetical protein